MTILLSLSAGCIGLSPPDDVVSIAQYYPIPPWVRDEEKRVVGVATRVYFLSGSTQRGVFVPGTIKAVLNAHTARPDGSVERTPAHEWKFSETEAEGFRVRKRAKLGDSYGFVLLWPSDLDVVGREIDIRFSYQKTEGQLINGRAVTLPECVPAPSGMRAAPLPPTQPTTSAPSDRAGSATVQPRPAGSG